MWKIIFVEYGLSKKIMSDSCGNFVWDKFKTLCNSLSTEQVFLSSYHHQSNGQVEACIKFVKCTVKKCFDSRDDPNIAVVQKYMTPLQQGLPSPATMLFNCPIRGIMPIINRPLFGIDNDEKHHVVIIKRQMKDDKNKDIPKNMFLSP